MSARLLVLLPLLMGAAWERPAEWSNDENDPYSIVVMDGLVAGVVANMEKKLAASQHNIVALELESWGGDGDEGMRLADFVSRWPKKVVIIHRCSSACSFAALVALGQGKLWVGPEAVVGMHQVRDVETKKADVQWTKMARGILLKYGAPKAPLDVMVATPPTAMAFLHEDQLIELGAAALRWGWIWWLLGESYE